MKLKVTSLWLLAFLLCIANSGASAQPVVACRVDGPNSSYIPALTQKFVLNGIRVFYTLMGEHAVVNTADINSNGIPDYVENVARQANAARRAYNLLGFRDPLESARYRSASYIDINLRNFPGNGLAYDETVSFSAVPVRDGACSIMSDISVNLASFPGTWSVVAHEIFHLYQYGSTMFKRAWVNEGTANWAERVLRVGALNNATGTPLPISMAEMQSQVFSSSLPVEFWGRLAGFIDQTDGFMHLPFDLRGATYVDGSAIFKDDYLRAIAFISYIYQALDAEDDLVTNANSWLPYLWAEADQTSATHDARILKVIQRAVRQTGITNSEIAAFLAIE